MTSSETNIITRFAPSPTGYLHIGGARTALFSWAFARKHQGKFLLRIEDTDRERSTEDAIQAILSGLDWLHLTPDAPPVYQHQNIERHREVIEQMLSSDLAYKCTCTKDALDEMREKAKAEGKPIRYDGTCRNKLSVPDDLPFTVRFKAPPEGATILEDLVQGYVTVENNQLDDLILLRSDGTPTYNLSVVVDDHDMGITHVIRGDDHLTNAVRQSQIFDALKWSRPTYAHIPLIHGPDGAKLSKRHGALGVEAYKDMGFLPEAMRNYLARLGWSHGDDELFSTEEFINWFDIAAIGKSPARLDMEKMQATNIHHIQQGNEDILADIVMERLALSQESKAKLMSALPMIKKTAKSLDNLIDNLRFLFLARPIELNDKALQSLTEDKLVNVRNVFPALQKLEAWDEDGIANFFGQFMEENELKLGQFGPVMRNMLTGSGSPLGVYDLLLLLGKEESLARLEDILSN
ncbi:MAG: glutamate--tRNA ligase [PS1 clade bacterium]|uniref:Glutamate--tRNA ligase n=1 Tax=PS1 clade bacterium TaxID=2175152 RepID=A0A368DXV7_9PROT|nr:MAG: glutamate--tRNA ligase [PS1 clade bacterium]